MTIIVVKIEITKGIKKSLSFIVIKTPCPIKIKGYIKVKRSILAFLYASPFKEKYKIVDKVKIKRPEMD